MSGYRVAVSYSVGGDITKVAEPFLEKIELVKNPFTAFMLYAMRDVEQVRSQHPKALVTFSLESELHEFTLQMLGPMECLSMSYRVKIGGSDSSIGLFDGLAPFAGVYANAIRLCSDVAEHCYYEARLKKGEKLCVEVFSGSTVLASLTVESRQ